ncbi:MAG TPA: SOS response-associated peptidase [Cyclobacteriaceae bacterium]|nr:SOS response-associated peptidase [Cyclobacteriaceae bacterium]
MSTRYSLSLSQEKLQQRFGVDVPDYYKPVYNAAPTQLLPIITAEHPEGISMFYWGIPPEQAKDKAVSTRLLHTKAEGFTEKAYLKRMLKKNRCIIPADGYYEWKASGKKSRIPYRVCLNNKEAFSFAGIWEEYETEEGDVHTFTIITTLANASVAEMNDRMPVIFDKQQEKVWLDPNTSESDLINLLKPIAAEKLFSYTVSPRVNNTKNNDEALLKQAPAADQFGNLSLFD